MKTCADEKSSLTAVETKNVSLAVDLTLVWDELAEHVLDGPSTGGDNLDAFGSRGGRYPELSPESQSLLAAGYQYGQKLRKAAAAGEIIEDDKVRRSIKEGTWCSEYLLGSVFRLVRVKVWERARGRFGDVWASEILPELLSDATSTVLEAAESFDASKGPTFASWASERLDHELPAHLGKHGRLGSTPQAWDRLSRIAHHVKPELEAKLGRAPSDSEVKVVLTERCKVWAEEHLSPEQEMLTGEEREKAILDKMRKQGMTKALTEVPEILAAMQPERNLDAPLGADSNVGLGDVLAGKDNPEEEALAVEDAAEYSQTLNVGTGNLGSKQKEMVLTYLGLGEEDGGTYRKVAQQFGVPDLEVRHLVRDTQARMRSPHAQYAHLASDISNQFDIPEVAEEVPAPAKAALTRRGRKAPMLVDDATLIQELSSY